VYRGALLLGDSPTRSGSWTRLNGPVIQRANLNPQTRGGGRERFRIVAQLPETLQTASVLGLPPEANRIKSASFARGAELVKAESRGSTGRAAESPENTGSRRQVGRSYE
jgi:hypothetical protein